MFRHYKSDFSKVKHYFNIHTTWDRVETCSCLKPVPSHRKYAVALCDIPLCYTSGTTGNPPQKICGCTMRYTTRKSASPTMRPAPQNICGRPVRYTGCDSKCGQAACCQYSSHKPLKRQMRKASIAWALSSFHQVTTLRPKLRLHLLGNPGSAGWSTKRPSMEGLLLMKVTCKLWDTPLSVSLHAT